MQDRRSWICQAMVEGKKCGRKNPHSFTKNDKVEIQRICTMCTATRPLVFQCPSCTFIDPEGLPLPFELTLNMKLLLEQFKQRSLSKKCKACDTTTLCKPQHCIYDIVNEEDEKSQDKRSNPFPFGEPRRQNPNLDVIMNEMVAAASRGSLAQIQRFLTEYPKVNINYQDTENGRTMIYEAIFNGHVEMVRYLAYLGCDTMIPNFGGYTVWDERYLKVDMYTIPWKVSCTQLLAFMMGMHPRLGANSPIQRFRHRSTFDKNILFVIAKFVWIPAKWHNLPKHQFQYKRPKKVKPVLV